MILVGLQELAASREGIVEAGRQADNICGDVGKDARCGLVVVGDLKANLLGQMLYGKAKCFLCVSLSAFSQP